jgi:hypothetical protein
VTNEMTTNGKTYKIPDESKSVRITNGKLFIDGKPVDDSSEVRNSVMTGTVNLGRSRELRRVHCD